jgi:hypothetical protein
MKEIELAEEKDCSFIWLFIIVRLLVYVWHHNVCVRITGYIVIF